jgi:hypothetical protein
VSEVRLGDVDTTPFNLSVFRPHDSFPAMVTEDSGNTSFVDNDDLYGHDIISK